MSITAGEDKLLYDYQVGDRTFCLSSLGRFYVRAANGECTALPWFKNKETSAPMIPAKRKSFVSLVKQCIREGDLD